jgi:DNA-binding transcriptional ArsR family regulator
LTKSVDITDPMLAKAFAHPLRVEILGLLENRVATPRQLAAELDAGLSQTSYHVRRLQAFRLIKLVKRRVIRGAVEHYYTATVRPTITDAGWARIRPVTKRALVGARLAQIGKEVSAAAERGGFDREDIHITRTRLHLTRDGWSAASRELKLALERIDAIAAESAELEHDPGIGSTEATLVMMFFESAPPGSFASSSAVSESTRGEVDDSASQG